MLGWLNYHHSAFGLSWHLGPPALTWTLLRPLCLLQLLGVERMNLYASSVRLCFLLFESMRIHLKFQLEVTVFAWDFGSFKTSNYLLKVDIEDVCRCVDVPEETDGHHHIREH